MLSERRVLCIQRDLCKAKPITSSVPTSTSPKDKFSNSEQNEKFLEMTATHLCSLHSLSVTPLPHSHLSFCLCCAFCLECRSPSSISACGEVLVGPLESSLLVSSCYFHRMSSFFILWLLYIPFFPALCSTVLQLFDLCLSFPLTCEWICLVLLPSKVLSTE